MKAVVQQARVPRETEPEAAQAFAGAASGLAQMMNEGPRAAAQQALRATLNPPVQRRVNSTGLPDALKSGVEDLSGLSLDDVRVHYNATTPAPLQAAAFTRGSEIHLAPGQERHLAHEAWHVVQQKQGRVKSTGTVAGQPLNDDAALEREADVMGGRALSEPAQRRALSSAERGAAVVQRVKKQVTGITHLVQARDDSVFEGDEVAQLRDRDIVDIDEDDVYLSRRGPNQEEFRETEDRDGPQHYEWFRVRTINGIAAAPDTYIREDTIEDVDEDDALDVEPRLIYGTDGRDEQQIRDAVRLGYRRFDTAQSYHTAHILAQVLGESGLDRSQYEIIYKFDVEAGETRQDLADWLMRVAAMFDGRIDTLAIHNVDGGDAAVREAWAVMGQLKRAGVVREIGVGNVKPRNAALIEELGAVSPIDVIENPLGSLLREGPAKAAIEASRARIAYYDVIETAGEANVLTPAGLRTLFTYIEQINPRSAAILSSRDGERNRRNLADFGGGGGGAWDMEAWARLDAWRAPREAVAVQAEEEPLNPVIRAFLVEILTDEATPAAQIQATLPQPVGQSTAPVPTQEQFERWLIDTRGLPPEILALRVPPRPGLMRRYEGERLAVALHTLLFGISCNQGPARQLVVLLLNSLDDWNDWVRAASEDITE